MARPRKDGIKVTFYLDREIHDQLVEYADKMGQTKTMAIERILAERFAEQKEKKSGEQ